MLFKHWNDLTSGECPLVFTPAQVTQIRELAGWTQIELGKRLGVSRQVVNRWERGRVKPDQRDCMAIRFAVVYHDLAP